MEDWRFIKGTKYYIDADSSKLWLEDYNVRVCSIATLLETPDSKAKKVLVKLDEIDGDHNVVCRINKRYLFNEISERKW